MSQITAPRPTKQQRKEAARDERLRKEQAEATAAARKRRLTRLGGVLAAALAIVAVAVALSSGGGDSKGAASGGAVAGVQETREMLAGIPQDGMVLGDPDAPVTVVEFVDPQCPFCARFATGELPRFVQDHVRTGRAKIELKVLTFLGPDSLEAARAIVAAGQRDQAWNAAERVFHNQGAENSGYITDAWLAKVVGPTPDVADPAVAKELAAAQALATRHGMDSTPSFLVGRSAGALSPVAQEDLGKKVQELAGT